MMFTDCSEDTSVCMWDMGECCLSVMVIDTPSSSERKEIGTSAQKDAVEAYEALGIPVKKEEMAMRCVDAANAALWSTEAGTYRQPETGITYESQCTEAPVVEEETEEGNAMTLSATVIAAASVLAAAF